MLRIKLHQFRCHEDAEFTFKKGKTNLIAGASGIGKTTIFEALLYVLYKGIKKPCTFGKTSCRVSLYDSDRDIEIIRTSKPHTVAIRGKKIFDGDAAQSFINAEYGSQMVFMSSCYLRQLERNPLFHGSNNEKLKLIRDICAIDQESGKLKEAVKSKLSSLAEGIIEQQQSISVKTALLDQFDAQHIDNLKSEQVQKYKKINVEDVEREITICKEELIKLREEKQVLQKLVIELASLEKSYEELLRRNKNILVKDTTEEEKKLATLQDTLRESKVSKVNIEKEVEKITVRLKKLSSSLGLTRGFKESDLQPKIDKLRSQLNESTEIMALLKQVNSLKVADLYKKQKANKEKLVELEQEREKYLRSLEAIEHNSKVTKVLTCPVCQSKLRYQDGLEPCDQHFEPRPVEVEVSKKDLEQLEKQIQKCTSTDEVYNNIINSLSSYTLKESKDTTKLSNKLSQYEEYLSFTNKKKELSSMPQEIEAITEEQYKQLQSDIEELQRVVDGEKKKAAEKEFLSTSIEEMDDKIHLLKKELGTRSLEQILKKINKMEHDIEELENCIKYHHLLKKRAHMEEELSILTLGKKDLEELREGTLYFREKINEAECLFLEKNVAIMNDEIEKTLQRLFNDPITVKLDTLRETKNKELRYQFDIKIYYRNNLYDSISQLSGGEQSRLSLALTLAFSKLTGKDVLLLDESLNSLNYELKTDIVDLLNELGKTVIVISHDDIAGMFDTVVEVK